MFFYMIFTQQYISIFYFFIINSNKQYDFDPVKELLMIVFLRIKTENNIQLNLYKYSAKKLLKKRIKSDNIPFDNIFQPFYVINLRKPLRDDD